VRAEPESAVAEDTVADGEVADSRADGGDLTRQLAAEDALPGMEEAADYAADEHERWAAPAVGFARRAVGAIHRGGMDADENLVVLRDWLSNLFEALDLWRPIPVIDHRSHWPLPLVSLASNKLIGRLAFTEASYPIRRLRRPVRTARCCYTQSGEFHLTWLMRGRC
jgi:hypothetical protein